MRRKIRTRKKHVVNISQNANKQIDRHIFRRWHNIKYAKRFAIGWVLLLALLTTGVIFQTRALGSYYLTAQPTNGGVYTEGIVGSFSNANPIFAVSTVDSSVSKLIFSSLFKYDSNNNLVGDLATGYELDAKGTTYTVKIKPNVVWHDGTKLTADDIVFTYQTIKNPDTKSPLLSNWNNIKVEKVDDLTVSFSLPNIYSPFPNSMTNGIIPKHILGTLTPSQIRSDKFNTNSPIGTGPFVWQSVSVNGGNETQTETIQLQKFGNYFLGSPKLDGITLTTYLDKKQLLEALDKKIILSASGVDLADQEIPSKYESTNFYQSSATMLFLNNQRIKEQTLRQALVRGSDTTELINKVGYPVIPVKSPFLIDQFAYNPAIVQLPFDKVTAENQLNQQGWVINSETGIRTKNGEKLSLKLVSENKPEYERLAKELQIQWSRLGIELDVVLQSSEEITKNYLISHDYDVLLYGINIGADPDVYAYWHSSQADKKSQSRLNLSEYKSTVADLALESGRSRQDEKLREAKYKPFLEVWSKDAPAVGLYQPRFLFLTNQHIYGLEPVIINTPSDRFNEIQNWQINTVRSNQ
jgi:peptide/nickel transport system substrate-binding protein